MPTRRTLLTTTAITLGSLAAGPVVAGCGVAAPGTTSRERPTCVARSQLSRRDEVGGVPLAYEENGRRQAFWLEPGFAARLDTWLAWWVEHSGLPAPDELVTFGTWIDGSGDCSSWHHAGRAFDVTALRRDGAVQVHARMDRIDRLPPEQQPPARRRYWQLAAGLSLHFADVLTALFDDAHRNHVHVDNGRSGSAQARFTGRSPVQTRTVQAVCAEVWGVPTALSGRWDGATRASVEQVLALDEVAPTLARLGGDGDLVGDEPTWQAFVTASVGRAG
ncbi:hypothetical protein GC722_16775 [Auraticoccus sp. F435]|uniref:Extensin-like C-terminal domain-containing protein n=1 Tax=Auraticoccus cholistanensis TaxID=2656650 RepID=A0A6A9V201_9ACTN|nr:hypothetical protein [Auraticoccus cholistanensis]MVA77656.1 hypothetical protein [Auraticoccus cholistanensis]